MRYVVAAVKITIVCGIVVLLLWLKLSFFVDPPYQRPVVSFSDTDFENNCKLWFESVHLPLWYPVDKKYGCWTAESNEIVPPGFVAIVSTRDGETVRPPCSPVVDGETYLLVPVREPEEGEEDDDSAKSLAEKAEELKAKFFKTIPDEWTVEDARLFYKFKQLAAMKIAAEIHYADNKSDYEKQGGASGTVMAAISTAIRRYNTLRISPGDMAELLRRLIGRGVPELLLKTTNWRFLGDELR